MDNPNQIDPRLAGTGTGLSPFISDNSSSRLMMLGSMLSQTLVIKHPDKRRLIAGSEPEYAKATWKISMPATGKIIKVIEKFPKRLGINTFNLNSQSLVIFENYEMRSKNILELGCFTLESYHSTHQNFGFKYRQLKTQKLLAPKEIIERGVTFCKSPNVTDDGNYTFGVQVPIALMSIPQIIEDGIVVSEKLCEKMETVVTGDRVASWGKQYFPRCLYGTSRRFKAHPDIGEKIREDGLLFALCEYVPMHGICEMDIYTMDENYYDPIFDELTFAEPEAEVIDIDVHHDINNNNPPTPVGMEVQQLRYAAALQSYTGDIINIIKDYYRQEKSLRLSPELSRISTEAQVLNTRDKSSAKSVTLAYRVTPIDDWRVRIKFAKTVRPTIGFKITGLHGDKAVIVEVRKHEDMPVNDWGHVAWAISDGDSSIKRNNIGRPEEMYINAKSWDVSEDIVALVSQDKRAEAEQLYCEYVRRVSPLMYNGLVEFQKTPEKWKTHFDDVIKNGVYLWYPTNNPVHSIYAIEAIRQWSPVRKSQVTYRGKSGRMVRTKSKVLIGSAYMFLLEKTGHDFAAVSTAKRNYLGVLSKLTNADKYSLPYREQPGKLLGEAEVRLLIAMVGPVITQRLLEYPNSAVAQKLIARAIMAASKPTGLNVIIDDSTYNPGHSASNGYVDMLHMCSGVRYAKGSRNL